MDFCMSAATQLILDGVKNNGSSINVVMSPLSIYMMLNMVASGSGGQTLEQFLKLLGSKSIDDLNDKSNLMRSLLSGASSSVPMTRYSSMDHDPRRKEKAPLFSLVNALWADHRFPFMPSFKEITQSIYKAQVKNVDFLTQAEQVKRDVNTCVENETKGLIKELLKPDVELRPPLCIANALYFKGAWLHNFNSSRTLHENFHLLNGETIRVPFMTSRDVHRSFASFDDFKVLKLPYQRGPFTHKQFSMYFFLPHEKNGLQDMMEKFNSNTTILQPKNFNLGVEKLSEVWIPKIKFSYDVDAKKIMQDKGLTLPFKEMEADFTNMVNAPPNSSVYIDRLLHKSYIEVNEEGTEAAAATVVSMVNFCGAPMYKPPPRHRFVADHPFMFMIVEESSELVIFTGAVLNPKSG